jgi:hypothetical protein
MESALSSPVTVLCVDMASGETPGDFSTVPVLKTMRVANHFVACLISNLNKGFAPIRWQTAATIQNEPGQVSMQNRSQT